MTPLSQPSDAPISVDDRAELQAQIIAAVDALVGREESDLRSDLEHLLARTDDLVAAKRRMEGAKTDTRDLLAELLFARVRRGLEAAFSGDRPASALRAAELVMGALFSVEALSEFAAAFDCSLKRVFADRADFNLAGRTDVISVEEVVQMLASGKHAGCLRVEKGDDRLDVYISAGRIAGLDPHRLKRRVLFGADAMTHREVPAAALADVEQQRSERGLPAVLLLAERGFIRPGELRDQLASFGKECLFEFMAEREPCAFSYWQLDELPAWVVDHDLRLGVTPLLLEGSRAVDEWRHLATVFPDIDAPLLPTDDMYARMGDLVLSVLEIKLLSEVDGEASPRSLVESLGLPLHEVHALLVRLSMDGVLVPSGDVESLRGLGRDLDLQTVQQSMSQAFAALDENDHVGQRRRAIDRVFGDAAASPLDVGAAGASGVRDRGRRHS